MEGVGLPTGTPAAPPLPPCLAPLGSGPGISPPKSFLLLLLSLLLLFLAALGICCCGQPFSSCNVWASHGAGVSCCGAPTLGARASVVVASGLSPAVESSPTRD